MEVGIGGDPGDEVDIGKGCIEAEGDPVDHMDPMDYMDHMAPVRTGLAERSVG